LITPLSVVLSHSRTPSRSRALGEVNSVHIWSLYPYSRSRLWIRMTYKILWGLPCLEIRLWRNLLEIWAKLWENSPSRSVEESFRKFPDIYSDVDYLQSLSSFSLSNGRSLVKFLW